MSRDVEDSSRLDLYARLLRIRRVEESLLDLFSQGALRGTTHTSIGQEAVAISVMDAIDKDRDIVFSSHRCHGHFLAYGGEPVALFAEIMGREAGVCGGLGGSQHIYYRNFHSNGIQGGIVPLAVGGGLAERYRGTGAISVVFLGDGTLGEGATYEALNMASLWSAPVLFVLEDNGYAQSTPRDLAVAGSIPARAAAFGIGTDDVTTNDVEELIPIMKERVRSVRENGAPFMQVVRTYRLAPHSKGDDNRDPQEIASWREKDPVGILGSRLAAEDREKVGMEIDSAIKSAIETAGASDWPGEDRLRDLVSVEGSLIPGRCESLHEATPDPRTGLLSLGRDLNLALHAIMEADPRVLLIGEDLLDPYGGAFKVSKGLSTRFGERVLSSPISEAGIVGVANGMALRGLRPIVEIMFGDFMALAADQILNHAAKFEGMYNRQVRCPVTIRTPMGGRRGYGPTHSQSIEALFLGIPGIEVVAVSPVHPAGALLHGAVLRSERPTLFIENKSLYPQPLLQPDASGFINDFTVRRGGGLYPTVHLSTSGFDRSDLVFITYGGCVGLAMKAAEKLLVEEEIDTEVIVVSQIAPLPIDDLLEPALRAGRALVIEEGPRAWGWGSEVVASLHERRDGRDIVIERVAARPFPIPVSPPLEDLVLPQEEDIRQAALSLFRRSPR